MGYEEESESTMIILHNLWRAHLEVMRARHAKYPLLVDHFSGFGIIEQMQII